MIDREFAVVVLAYLALIGTILLFRSWPVETAELRSYFCEPNRCTLMDWLSATAGWAGFAAALIGAWLVYRQLSEQKKQTDVMLGNVTPDVFLEVTYSPNEPLASVEITVINRNRRPLRIDTLQLKNIDPALDLDIGVAQINADGERVFRPPLHQMRRFKNMFFTLKGRDGSTVAPECTIICFIYSAGHRVAASWVDDQFTEHDFTVELNAILLGDTGYPVTLEAQGRILL